MIKLINDDCLKALQELPENSIDTCITDPPYGLRFMGKEWDTFRQNRRAKSQIINMGVGMRQLNHSELIEYQEWTFEWAQAVYRVLKPGGLLLSFGGTRTYHRIVCAIEDACFEIRDCVMWVYGSGFPKSLDISKGIDKRFGKEREIIGRGESKGMQGCSLRNYEQGARPYINGIPNQDGYNLTAPATLEAQLWDGWGTQLKPAYEPIVVAQKPLDGTYAENALKWGVAGYWIDGGRIGTEEHIVHGKEAGKFQPNGGETIKDYHEVQGRFPANLILDDSTQVAELFPNNAARFFYCAKASRSERNAGLEGMELKIGGGMKGTADQTLLTGSGNIRNNKMQNHHPTVKPLELMRYLVRLTKTPTGGVVLDPFMGSGTTGCACVLENRDFIGIEKEAEYIEIAQKRIGYYQTPLEKFANGNENYD